MRKDKRKISYKKAFPTRRARFIAWIARRVYRHKLVDVPDVGEEPVVFVCNHNEVYGPIAANAFLPFNVAPWTNHIMTEPKEAKRAAYDELVLLKWPKWLAKPCAALFTKIVVPLIDLRGCIPIYYDIRVSRTFKLSVAAMQEGRSLLIFPENPERTGWEHYRKDDVAMFSDGFAAVAYLYYKKTGKRLRFYAMYCDRDNREIRFDGAPVEYEPDREDGAERARIAAELYQKMKALCHKKVPPQAERSQEEERLPQCPQEGQVFTEGVSAAV